MNKYLNITEMVKRYQFNRDETKTKIIQFMEREPFVLPCNTVWTYAMCSNMIEKKYIYTGNKWLKSI